MRQGDFSGSRRFFWLIPLAMAIGGASTLLAWLLLHFIDFFTQLFFFGRLSWAKASPADHALGPWVILIPALGGLIIGLMARFGSEQIRGHGIPEALEAILYGKSIMKLKVALLKPLSSAISIGSGGPYGAEGPIIMTGGAAGSLLAQLFHLTAAERKTLLVAGAAAGMSAVFATPLAAILLAVELLLFEWKPRSLVPVATASIIAATLRPWVLGPGPLFPLHFKLAFGPTNLWVFVLIGLIAGAFSTATSNLLYKLEDIFQDLPVHWMWWPAIGGLIVGLGGYFQPRSLGVGYDVIGDLLQGQLLAQDALPLLTVKGLIWVISLASGTSGGVLAPLLMMGCGLGTVEGLFLPSTGQALYPLVSMAAVMGGMMRAPFTALAFGLELTQDTDALMPMLSATLVAYAFTVLVMKRSILTEKIARRGFDVFREYGLDPLETMQVGQAMTASVTTLPEEMPVQQAIAAYFGSNRCHNGYPIVDSQGEPIGMFTASDLLEQATGAELPDETLGQWARKPLHTISPRHSCREAAEVMAAWNVGRLAVVNENSQLVGIITRSDLLKPRLGHYQLESLTEKVLGASAANPSQTP